MRLETRDPVERLLSKWRVASRTEVRRLVAAGRVTVNGRLLRDARFLADAHDRIEVDGRRVGPSTRSFTWLALNKPRGVVTTTTDPEGRRTVMDLLPERPPPGVAPVGRLDKASAGLLLLTDEHELASRLLDPESHVVKRYRVKVRGRLHEEDLRRLRAREVLEDGPSLGPMTVELESEGPRSSWILVGLREGKNRQIRRRLEALGHSIEHLIRLTFGPVALGNLAPGEVRSLSREEIAALRSAARPRPRTR